MSNQPFLARSKKIVWLIGAFMVLAIALAACQPASVSPLPPVATSAPVVTTAPTAIPEVTTAPEATVAPEVTTAPVAPTGAEAVINIADDPNLGMILVDGQGMTLYMFTKDEPDKTNCSGKCLENWPPLLTQGNPTLGDGVDASLVGTATLEDGSMIVTYNHMPLYYWIKDMAPGDATGQGNNDVWYVVAPDGNPVGIDVLIKVAEDPNLGQILDGDGMTCTCQRRTHNQPAARQLGRHC
jgi:predicted lipoprotein with Yx(FWY)xxD motif